MKRLCIKKALASLVKETLRYRKKKGSLALQGQSEIETDIIALHQCIKSRGSKKELKEADARLQQTIDKCIPRTWVEKSIEFFSAVVIALMFAVFIRSEWFEFYHVPTGSMRDTVLEKDNFVVSKDAFGLNIPLSPGHFYFDSNLLKRMSVALFSGEGLPISSNTTRYFWIFPGVKQYVKRIVARGGDAVYFYGGKIYSVDAHGKDLKEVRQGPWAQNTYIPYYSPIGRMALGHANGAFIFSQMNIPLLSVRLLGDSTVDVEFFDGSRWSSPRLESNKNYPSQYRELWGLGNFAQVRMVENEGSFFLKLYTLPKLVQDAWEIRNSGYQSYPVLKLNTSLIPLDSNHIDRLWDALYTARFVVKNKKAMLYDYQHLHSSFSLDMPEVQDGTYEFQNGKLYQIGFLGHRKQVKSNHPLLHKSPKLLMQLFNLGMHFNTEFMKPSSPEVPQRFAYYRDGSLYVMNTEVYSKKDPILKAFISEQIGQQQRAGLASSFVAFIDRGAPVNRDGSIDQNFIRQFGLSVPKGHVMALGDNYAQSGDSRFFGFVPYENLRGKAIYTFWPLSSARLLEQPSSPMLTLPRVIVWVAALCVLVGIGVYRSQKRKKAILWIESEFI